MVGALEVSGAGGAVVLERDFLRWRRPARSSTPSENARAVSDVEMVVSPTHKDTHTAALDALGRTLGLPTFTATAGGYESLLDWLRCSVWSSASAWRAPARTGPGSHATFARSEWTPWT